MKVKHNKSKKNIENIFKELDNWVSKQGSGRYIPNNCVSNTDVDFSLPEDFGIQQVEDEIKELVKVLLERGNLSYVLEIGLGYFGSTHFLWRQLFDHVFTIEYQKERILDFNKNMRRYYLKPVLNDGKSAFFFGYSYSPTVFSRVHKRLNGKKIDLLFIDGDHSYEGVFADWKLYSHFVSSGGIVVFHDVVNNITDCGVPRFINDLMNGKIDGIKKEINFIVLSKNVGIGYYIV